MSVHDTTREVFLAHGVDDPLAFQVNYYDYLNARLIPSTDVFEAGRLVYRTNALGCRGDDLDPEVPVLALFGADLVHGPREGGFAERLSLPPFRVLNAGVEALTTHQIVERFVEVNAATTLAAALVVPALEGLTPAWITDQNAPTAPGMEDYWRAMLDPVEGPALIAFLPLAAASWTGDAGVEGPLQRRFDGFLQAYCQDRGFLFIDKVPARPASLRGRLSALLKPRPAAAAPSIEAVVEAGLAGPLAALIPAKPTRADRAPSGDKSPMDGAADIGRNYPLW